jgi:2-methylisocitrate lyase-like PEP mutase family enzyme
MELVWKESLANLTVARTHHYALTGVATVLADELVLVETLDRLMKAWHVPVLANVR